MPGLHDKVDFRMQYMPTGHGDLLGLGDYDGKKFLLAWKLGGFEPFKDGPLRYLEIHTGYYSRGYGDGVHPTGPSAHPDGLCGARPEPLRTACSRSRACGTRRSGRPAAPCGKYIQVPYTYVSSDGNSGR